MCEDAGWRKTKLLWKSLKLTAHRELKLVHVIIYLAPSCGSLELTRTARNPHSHYFEEFGVVYTYK
jgi:hypothetical protein